MKSHRLNSTFRLARSALLSTFLLTLLVALASVCLQIVAIPRERPGARTIKLTARWADPDDEELESVSICPHVVRPELPPLAAVPGFREEDWLPQLTIEFADWSCRLSPPLPIGSEQDKQAASKADRAGETPTPRE